MPAPTRFTADRRAWLLGMVSAGATLEDACAEVGVSRTTVDRWAARGRAETDTPAAEFATALADARARHAQAPPLSTDDLVALVEEQARKGSMSAIKLLIDRPWEDTPREGATSKAPAASGGDRWAELDAATQAGSDDELTPRRLAKARGGASKRRRRRAS